MSWRKVTTIFRWFVGAITAADTKITEIRGFDGPSRSTPPPVLTEFTGFTSRLSKRRTRVFTEPSRNTQAFTETPAPVLHRDNWIFDKTITVLDKLSQRELDYVGLHRVRPLDFDASKQFVRK
jgi:hypothetical protein